MGRTRGLRAGVGGGRTVYVGTGAPSAAQQPAQRCDETGDAVGQVLHHHPTGIPVRDSKNPTGPAIVFPAVGWASFVRAVGNGELPV